MAQAAQVIELLTDPQGQFIHSEAITAAASAVVPGMLVEETTAGTLQEHSTAAGNAQKLFALANLTNAGTIDTAYAVGATARYGAAHSGQEANALLAAAATAVTRGAPLESAGDGTLRVQGASAATSQLQRDSVVAYALEAVDNSGGGTTARIRVRVA